MSYSSYAFDQRDAQRARLNATNVQVVRTCGFVNTTGAGEGVVDVTFSRIYIEKPAMSMGGEITNGVLTAGLYPTVSIVVVSWVTAVTPASVHYTGARLAVVTTGDSSQQMTVHWQAEGKALATPQ